MDKVRRGHVKTAPADDSDARPSNRRRKDMIRYPLSLHLRVITVTEPGFSDEENVNVEFKELGSTLAMPTGFRNLTA